MKKSLPNHPIFRARLSLAFAPLQFNVSPQAGEIPPGGTAPIVVTFHPTQTGHCSLDLKVFDNNKTGSAVRVRGFGGDGLIGLKYLTRRDEAAQGLDFDAVNIWSHVSKNFVIVNKGSAALYLRLNSSNPAFALTLAHAAEPFADDAALSGRCAELQLHVPRVTEWRPHDFEAVVARAAADAQAAALPAYFYKAAAACRQRHDALKKAESPSDRARVAAKKAAKAKKKKAAAAKGGGIAFGTNAREGDDDGFEDESDRESGNEKDDDDDDEVDEDGSDTDEDAEIGNAVPLVSGGAAASALVRQLSAASDFSAEGSSSSSSSTSSSSSSSSGGASSRPASALHIEQLELVLPPACWLAVGARLSVDGEKAFASAVSIASDFDCVVVPLKAQGGSVNIMLDNSGGGSLDFGNIATMRPYTRRLTLINKGNIAASASVYWSLPPPANTNSSMTLAQKQSQPQSPSQAQTKHAQVWNQTRSAVVELDQSGVRRARVWWRRVITTVIALLHNWLAKHGNQGVGPAGGGGGGGGGSSSHNGGGRGGGRSGTRVLGADVHRAIVAPILVEDEIRVAEFQMARDRNISAAADPRVSSLSSPSARLYQQKTSFGSAADALHARGATTSLAIAGIVTRLDRKINAAHNPALFSLMEEARADQGRLVRRIKAERPIEHIPQLHASPAVVVLPPGARVELTVAINIPKAAPFAAALVVDCEAPGVQPLRVQLTAHPSDSAMAVEGDPYLDFGRVPIGQISVLVRTVANRGDLPIQVRVWVDWSSHSNGGKELVARRLACA